MREHFLEGGWGMWPTLVIGLAGLGAGLRYAMTGDRRLRGTLESLAKTVLFFALSGFFTGIVATGDYLGAHAAAEVPMAAIALTGVKESTNNLALGFTVLALLHLQLAVGRRREDARST